LPADSELFSFLLFELQAEHETDLGNDDVAVIPRCSVQLDQHALVSHLGDRALTELKLIKSPLVTGTDDLLLRGRKRYHFDIGKFLSDFDWLMTDVKRGLCQVAIISGCAPSCT
jgi:hypothetical protein